MTYFRAIVVAVALAVVLYLLAQLRARRIRERYVWLWLILLAGVGVIALFPGLMSQLAMILGFQVSSNLVLTAAAIVTFLVTVILSAAVSALQMSVRTLTEEIAFLRCDVDRLQDKIIPPAGDSADGSASLDGETRSAPDGD
ncbi:MAG TPA: DUF2304 domain-containing protein [Actinomycetota bacterium]|nr:DUF2304 domain-containing protein [Actinomycetota bacterium]